MQNKLKVLDLFSGIGGFSLGLERTGGFKTAAFCEIDPWCRRVLKKHWPDVPIYKDVGKVEYEGPIDLICGGYPCQGESVAGHQRGTQDVRWKWPEMFNCIKAYRPYWVIGENVANHANMGVDLVFDDLESEGYAAQAFIIPACAVGARHRRNRIWIIANATGQQSNQKHIKYDGQKQREFGRIYGRQGTYWGNESRMDRVCYGVSHRMDRIKGLGNAVVPQIPELLGYMILKAHNESI